MNDYLYRYSISLIFKPVKESEWQISHLFSTHFFKKKVIAGWLLFWSAAYIDRARYSVSSDETTIVNF